MQHWEPWLRRILLSSGAVVLVAAVMDRRWLWLAAVAVVLAAHLALSRRARSLERRPRPEPQEWSDERVRQVLAASGGKHIAAVKALRETDPALSLQEADQLVRQVAR